MKRAGVNMKSCICGKSKPFTECCEPFLSGQKHAKTPEQLMRSRFSAYALGGYGEYLISTWLPASAHGLTAPELSKKTVNWQGLDVIASSQRGDNGVVEFKAWFCKSPTSDEMDIMHEVSEFIRVQSRWLYTGARGS
jgi:SEC-C motif-containing protein